MGRAALPLFGPQGLPKGMETDLNITTGEFARHGCRTEAHSSAKTARVVKIIEEGTRASLGGKLVDSFSLSSNFFHCVEAMLTQQRSFRASLQRGQGPELVRARSFTLSSFAIQDAVPVDAH